MILAPFKSLFTTATRPRYSGRTLENPQTSLSDPDDWLYDAFGGTPSASGERVNVNAALSSSPFWRAANLVTRDIGKVRCILYERLPDGGKRRATQHPAFKLVARRPSPYYKAVTFKQTIALHAFCVGNGYAYIVRRGDGTPVELLLLDPQSTFPVRENGVLWYVTRFPFEDRQEQRKLDPSSVIHIRGLTWDGLQGYNTISVCKDGIGTELATRKYTGKFFANNAEPRVVLEVPAGVSFQKPQIEELLRGWNGMHQGVDNAHKTAVLNAGIKANPFSSSAKDSQLDELRKAGVRDVSNVTGVPAYKLGSPDHNTYASLEQASQDYLSDALDPWFVEMEEEFTDKLLGEVEKEADSHFFEFNRAALLRVDYKSETESLVSEVNNGLLLPDEARSIRNRPAMPDGAGQKFRIPSNIAIIDPATGMPLAPAPAAAKPESPMPDADPKPDDMPMDPKMDPKSRDRRLLVDALGRMARRLGTQATRAAGKGGDAYMEWVEGPLREKNGAAVASALGDGLAARFMDAAEDAMLKASEVREGALAASVAAAAKEFERFAISEPWEV